MSSSQHNHVWGDSLTMEPPVVSQLLILDMELSHHVTDMFTELLGLLVICIAKKFKKILLQICTV